MYNPLGCLVVLVIAFFILKLFFAVIGYVFWFFVWVVAIIFVVGLGWKLYKKITAKLVANDKVIDFVFLTLGYYSGKSSGIDQSLMYKHLGDIVEYLKLSDQQKQVAQARFSQGTVLSESQIKQMFRDSADLFSNNYERDILLRWFGEVFFFDNIITLEEQKYFFQIASSLGYSQEHSQHKFETLVKKFNYVFDGATGCYVSGFNFKEFFNKFFQQATGAQGTYGDSSSGGSGSSYATPNQNDIAAAYRILGIDESTSDSDAKKAYLRLMNRYHPDKALARGATSDEINKCKDMTQKIQSAWQVIKQHRNL